MPLTISRKHDMRLNLKLAGMFNGARRLWNTPRTEVDKSTATGVVEAPDSVDTEMIALDQLNGTNQIVTDDRPFIANDDEWRDRIPKRGLKKIVRFYRRIKSRIELLRKLKNPDLPMQAKIDMFRLGRELTSFELSEINEHETRRRLDSFHKDRSRYGERLLVETLARLGFCVRVISEKGHETIKNKIRFDVVEFSPIVYRYHVDARRLPWKISIMDLYQEGVCTTLSASVQHPVRAEIQQYGQFVTGLWYSIEIAGALGIPNKCYFADLLPLIPESAPPLSFLLGYGENKRPYWRSLEDAPHVLGGGQTMGGKSNMMHVMICTFVSRNSPEDVRLVMLDMKFGGIELGRYEGIPHLITDIPMYKKAPKKLAEEIEVDEGESDDEEIADEPQAAVVLEDGDVDEDEDDDIEKPFNGIAANPAQAVSVLRWAVKEGSRRGKLFQKEKIQNLKQWNRKHKTRRMPEVVICIDELAQLRFDPDYGLDAYHLIRELGSTSRASGIHLMAFTQSSNKRVVDEMVKVNFPMRICFSVPDSASSVLFVGTGAAVNLSPAGRCVFKNGMDNFTIQTPLIETSEIDQIVAKAKKGEKVKNLDKIHITPEEIIDWAIEDNGSSLAVLDVRHKFGERIEARALESMLKDMEGGTFIVGDRTYQVLPGAGKKPRIVARV